MQAVGEERCIIRPHRRRSTLFPTTGSERRFRHSRLAPDPHPTPEFSAGQHRNRAGRGMSAKTAILYTSSAVPSHSTQSGMSEERHGRPGRLFRQQQHASRVARVLFGSLLSLHCTCPSLRPHPPLTRSRGERAMLGADVTCGRGQLARGAGTSCPPPARRPWSRSHTTGPGSTACCRCCSC